MKKYTDKNGHVWDVEFWAANADNAMSCGSLIRNLAADLDLAVAGWKARGEEIDRLQAHVDRCHDWRKYALAWEDWGDGEPVTKPQRSRFGL